MEVRRHKSPLTEFDHKPWSPWFNHFEIKLTLVAGNDVRFVTVVKAVRSEIEN